MTTRNQQQPSGAALPERAPAQPRPSITQSLQQMQGEIARALPRHMSGDRFTRIVLTQVRKTPQLAVCTPASFFGALLTASALGLEPGVNGECYLIPYKDNKRQVTECQLIVGYQGVVKLFWQHPLAKRVVTDYVCEADYFDYSKGLVPTLIHQPAREPVERGQIVAYYALVELTTGAVQWDVFTPEQIRTLRRGKEGPNGDIPDPEHWMERKTALKQVLKLMPKAYELGRVIAVDEQPGSMDTARTIVQQIDLDPDDQPEPEPSER